MTIENTQVNSVRVVLYDDCHEHCAEMYGETRDAVARMMRFLHTDLACQWSEYDVCGDVMAGRLNRITFGLWDRITHNAREKKANDFISCGNPDCWPFISNEQYENAIQNPKIDLVMKQVTASKRIDPALETAR